MKKLLFFSLIALMSLKLSAQPGWEAFWTGFATESRYPGYIYISDDDTHPIAWIMAYDGSSSHADTHAIAKSTDNGETWVTYDPLTLNGTVNPGLSMIFATDQNTAYIAVYKQNIGHKGVWKTTDGGASWNKITTSSMFPDNNNDAFPNVVYFYDANSGFVQGDPINGEFEIYTTTDAGASWTPVSGANIDNPEPDETGYTHGIAHAGSTTWFTTSHGRLYRSTDNAATWTAHQTPLNDFGGQRNNQTGDVGSIAFKDDNEGWIIKSTGELYHTTDAGDNWTLQTTTGLNSFSQDIAYVPAMNGYPEMLIIVDARSNQSGSAYSTDGGNTWTKITSYKIGPSWGTLTGTGFVQHTAVAASSHLVLSGGFSHQHDANDPNDAPDQGIFRYVHDVAGIADQKIEGLSVYPNPASDRVVIRTVNSSIEAITIYDMTGKAVIDLHNADVDNLSVNTSKLQGGVYIMKVVDSNNAQQSVKLVIR